MTTHPYKFSSRVRNGHCADCNRPKSSVFHNLSRADYLSAHFKIGNVILSDYWQTYDVVIRFSPTTCERGWFVTVIHCDAQGHRIDASDRERTHYTSPDARDKVVCNVNDFVTIGA